MLRNSVQMSWITVLLYVSSFIEGFTTFGNLEDYKLSPVVQQRCVLPQYPESGGYVVINETNARPEDAFDEVSLIMYTSDEEFKLEIVYFTCIRGAWSREVLKSVRKHTWPIKPDTGAHLKNQEKSPDATTNSEYCKLPPHREHGLYIVAVDAAADSSDEFRTVVLKYICDEGFSVSGKTYIRCENGTWFDEAPECVETIKLPDDGGQVQSRFSINSESHTCKLPPQPEHGHYTVELDSHVDFGNNSNFLGLRYFCLTGYGIDGNDYVECSNGMWSEELPTCIEGCHLENVPGVSYLCKEENSDEFSTFCWNYKPHGAEVSPICGTPYYRSSEELPPMKCVDGKWNYTPSCLPECGIQNSDRRFRQVTHVLHEAGGWSAMKRELPWHVGIYSKLYQPYMQICSGSIISSKLVVTAAHCFWNNLEGLEPGSRFAVAAGKLYRPWGSPYDLEAQFSDVKDIVIPKRFRGAQTNFQDDIAIMYLSNSFVFNMDVWPVCIDFDLNSDRKHLTAGNLGKVAGWGLTMEDGNPSPVLQVVNLPYVDIDQCLANASPDFRAYITSDKICAGYTNGTALCKGDSGGGLAFAETEGRYKRYYLRGIASTAPNNDKLCNTHTVTTFTQILGHEHFIKDHLNLSTV